MGKEARTILNKKIAMELIAKNFKLYDVQPSIKIPKEIAFIFEKSELFEEEYNILVNSERVLKNMNGLTLTDIRTLIGLLQGYKIEDDERFPIMDKLQSLDDLICGYKAPVINEEIIEAKVEPINDVNIDDLKQAMTGCK